MNCHTEPSPTSSSVPAYSIFRYDPRAGINIYFEQGVPESLIDYAILKVNKRVVGLPLSRETKAVVIKTLDDLLLSLVSAGVLWRSAIASTEWLFDKNRISDDEETRGRVLSGFEITGLSITRVNVPEQSKKRLSKNPVHEHDGAWWFWDEVWFNRVGPYATEQEAKDAIAEYAAKLEIPRELVGEIIHALHGGSALCGFNENSSSADWPSGHAWAGVHAFAKTEANKRCHACEAAVQRVASGETKT